MSAPQLSIVIATKDRAGFLERALGSLAAQRNAPPFETIVVDNGSRDGTAQLITHWSGRRDVAVRYRFVAQPNRGAARNAGVAVAVAPIVVFVDDDVVVPDGFVAAHATAHRGIFPVVASGPILNVEDAGSRPKPSFSNYSGAFFCTCNVSVPRAALEAVGGFDEGFDLYGWEDTELGLRLRRRDLRHVFAWDAYLWHIKPAQSETLEVLLTKVTERATMAARLLRKDRSWRTRLATGAYGPNLVRAAVFAPRWSFDFYSGLASDARLPSAVRDFARKQMLDIAYTTALRRALAGAEPSGVAS